MKYRVCAALCALLTSVVVRATPYWVEYDASSGMWPESQGWTRYTTYGGAQRGFEEGALVIDSRASTLITDSYVIVRPGVLDPGPGEVFVMQWRLRTDELVGPWDSSIAVFSDERRLVTLDFQLDGVHVPGVGLVATFDPGVFHDFEFHSSDMSTFALYVDGAVSYEGDFTVPLLSSSTVIWADGIQGGASLSRWEYFRFGVTPESSGVFLALLLGLAVLQRARAGRR